MINAEVRKNNNENAVGLIRRFSKKVQGSSVLKTVKGRRYHQRQLSSYTKKKNRLKSLEKKEKIEEMLKLGKPIGKK